MKKAIIKDQSGSVLMISLVILLVLTVLGVSGMNTTVLQERMAGNVQDRNVAFQAAEAGLRDAELDISDNYSNTTVFKENCANGRCEPASYGEEVVWNSATLDVWSDTSKSVEYGTNTANTSFPNVALQPRYIIERLRVPSSDGDLEDINLNPSWYRITAIGTGGYASNTTTVMVQSVYRK